MNSHLELHLSFDPGIVAVAKGLSKSTSGYKRSLISKPKAIQKNQTVYRDYFYRALFIMFRNSIAMKLKLLMNGGKTDVNFKH